MPRTRLDAYPTLEHLSILGEEGDLDEDLEPNHQSTCRTSSSRRH